MTEPVGISREMGNSILSYDDKWPEIAPRVFVADTARIIGRVSLGEGVNVWYSAVIRGDIDAIEVGEYANVQDGAVLHVDKGRPLSVGPYCVIGHGAILHGCRIGRASMVGMGAVVLSGAEVGSGSIIAAGALVPEGKRIPEGVLAMGVPARVVRELSPEEREGIYAQARRYYRRGLKYAGWGDAGGTDGGD